MRKFIELSKEEAIQVSGGFTFLQKLGYTVGAACANLYDFVDGFFTGLSE